MVSHAHQSLVASRDGILCLVDSLTGDVVTTLSLEDEIHHDPVVHDQTVYINATHKLYSLDTKTKQLNWTHEFGDSNPHHNSLPAVNEGVIVVARDSTLFVFEQGSGTVRWSRSLDGTEFIDARPLVVEGHICVGTDLGTIVSYDFRGNENWTSSVDSWVRGGLSLAGDTVVAGTTGSLVGIDLQTGTQNWTVDMGGWVSTVPTVRNSVVFATSLSGAIAAIHAVDGHTKWTHVSGGSSLSSKIDSIWTPAAICGDVVCFGDDEGVLYALDAHTGHELWTHQSSISRSQFTLVSAQDHFLYSCCGSIRAVDCQTGNRRWCHRSQSPWTASPSQYEELASLSLGFRQRTSSTMYRHTVARIPRR